MFWFSEEYENSHFSYKAIILLCKASLINISQIFFEKKEKRKANLKSMRKFFCYIN